MATVNLGAIKFNWKGAYNNSTQYQVDDVVSSGGSSYVCILASQGNAVSNGTYWSLMAEGGNISTTITTQGDLLYRDGSGLARLAAGTSGQVLQTGGSGANPSWVNQAGGGLLQVHAGTKSTGSTSTSSNTHVSAGITESITPTSASSKILINYQAHPQIASGRAYFDIVRNGTTYISGNGTSNGSGIYNLENARAENSFTSMWYIDSPNSTSSVSYNVVFRSSNSTSVSSNAGSSHTFINLFEIDGSIF